MGLFVLLMLGLALAWVLMVLATWRWLTHPPRRTYANAVARGRPGDPSEVRGTDGAGLSYREFVFSSRGRELPAWEIVGGSRVVEEGGEGSRGRGAVVVFSHGWGDSRVGALSRVAAIVGACSKVIVWDMPGHGEASGSCELGVGEVDDLLALIQVVVGEGIGDEGRRGVADKVVLMGSSMGAGVSIVAAARAGALVRGVIAEAPYREMETPARNVLRHAGLPWRTTLRAGLALAALVTRGRLRHVEFDRAAWAAKLSCPLLVVHGLEDEVSPVEDGREIAARVGRGGTFAGIPGGGHHGLWTRPETAEAASRAVFAFFRELDDGEAAEGAEEAAVGEAEDA